MRALIIFLLPTIAGCFYFTALQQPEVLQPRDVRGGLGVSYVGSHGPLSESSFRVGIVHNVDVGAKIGFIGAGSNHLFGLIPYYDARYQMATEPLHIALGIGLTRFALDSYPAGRGDVFVRSLQPFTLVGQKNWYVGIRPHFSFGSGKDSYVSQTLVFHDPKMVCTVLHSWRSCQGC